MKLFIPASLFNHVYSNRIDTDDDYIYAIERKYKGYTLLYVIASYNGKRLHKSHIIRSGDTGHVKINTRNIATGKETH